MIADEENFSINNILNILISKGLLTKEQAVKAQAWAGQHNSPLGLSLIQNGFLSGLQLAEIYAEFWGLAYFNLDELNKAQIPHQLISPKLISQHHVLPLFIKENRLHLAIADPVQLSLVREIQFQVNLEVEVFITEYDKLLNLIQSIQYTFVDKADEKIIHLVQAFLSDAISKKASDIHCEAQKNFYRIRMRVDGILHTMMDLPLELAPQIIARLKVMSKLNIAEKRLPQDGRFSFETDLKKIKDCRISTCPTLYEEKIVIRILDANTIKLDVDDLGLEDNQKKLFAQYIQKPQGMILVTGPTGCGKTITLYTALSLMNAAQKNISTVEDPIEIQLTGINQVNINPKINLSFSMILRAFLRQDPDIIMVGEIRDKETAEIAIRAAQTGHLVLSTLHTNSAVESLLRLMNIGISAFNIAHSVSLIIAQRLLRKLCVHCKKPVASEFKSVTVYGPEGCPKCIKGYQGRIGVFECLPLTEDLIQIIVAGGGTQEIAKHVAKLKMQTLYESALNKLRAGITGMDEINRVIN